MDQRIQNPAYVDHTEIGGEIAAGHRVILQFSEPAYTSPLLQAANEACKRFGPDLEIRFYGHYKGAFDAAALDHLPDAEALSIDCLMRATGLERLASHRPLRRLSLGVFDGLDPGLLRSIDLSALERLVVSETRKHDLDLSPIASASCLRELFINGHTRGIASLTRLPELRTLSLASIPRKQSLAFVSGIASLRDLRLILGGRDDIREIVHPDLEGLAIELVRGFAHLDNLPHYPALRRLLVADQIRLEQLNFAPGNERLESVRIANCKKLARLDGLGCLTALRELRLAGTALDVGALLARPLPPGLEAFAVYTGSGRKNEAIRKQLDVLGYRESL